MSLRAELEALSPAKLIETLSFRIYEPPLCRSQDRLRQITESLRVPKLVLDFVTEVCVNGILGFLENSTGQLFPKTVCVFEQIGASEIVSILRAIEKSLESHRVTPARLRADFAGTQPYNLTTFREISGDLESMSSEVEEDARQLDLYGKPGTREPVWSLL